MANLLNLLTISQIAVLIIFHSIQSHGAIVDLNQRPFQTLLETTNFKNPGLDSNIAKDFITDSIVPKYVNSFLSSFESNNGTILQEGLLPLFEGITNDDCKGHLLEYILRLNSSLWMTEKDKWAAQMLDSAGKIPEGILTGHVNSYGDFEECIESSANNIEVLNTLFPKISKNFGGSYCKVYILDYNTSHFAADREINGLNELQTVNLYDERSIGVQEAKSVPDFVATLLKQLQNPTMIIMLPSVAMCMPSSCSTFDVQNFLVNAAEFAYAKSPNPKSLPWPVVSDCYDGNKPDMDAFTIVFIVFLSILTTLCVATGIYDYWINHGVDEKVIKERKVSKAYHYLMAFSFYSNTKKWLSTRKSADDLGALHGIRFFSTCWVVLGHSYFVFMQGPTWNTLDMQNVWKDWTSLAVINGTFSVDSFYVMSGMLATYGILRLLDKTKGKFNVPMFYVHRIVRLSPTYIILIGISASITVYIGNGPGWRNIEMSREVCRKNWWINILYINNLYRSNEMCMGESWYISNDMLYYILSPLIVYPIWKNRKIGLSLLAVYTVLSCVSPYLVFELKDTMSVTVLTGTLDRLENMQEIYMRPWSRISTFLVGVWLGYILHITRGKRIRIPPLLVIAGWIASAGIALTVILAVQPAFEPGYKMNHTAEAFYAALSRFAYAVAFSWVVFACVKGYGGFVNVFLSWKVFMPLGRLCFCVYLLSLTFQTHFHLSLSIPIKFSTYNIVNLFFSHTVISYLAGFVATMLFESPFIVLQKLVFESK